MGKSTTDDHDDEIGRFDLVRSLIKDELSAKQHQRINTCVENSAEAQQSLQQAQEHLDAFERARARQWMALHHRLEQQSTTRANQRRFSMWRGFMGAFAVLLCGISVTVLLRDNPSDPGPTRTPTDHYAIRTRYKGELAAQIIAKRGEDQFVVRRGMNLYSDDALRFVVQAEKAGFIAVFAHSGGARQTTVSQFYPQINSPTNSDAALAISSGRTVLPGSIILDDFVGTEVLIIVFSRKAFSAKNIAREIMQSVQRTHRRPLRADDLGIQGQLFIVPINKVKKPQ